MITQYIADCITKYVYWRTSIPSEQHGAPSNQIYRNHGPREYNSSQKAVAAPAAMNNKEIICLQLQL